MEAKSYRTIKGDGCGEIVEKRSRFIASVKPVTCEEEAISYINELKQKYWDARHNVYAYIIRENNIMRYSDDGEPSGTAGVPVLEILKKENLTDIVVVVTRYFGGILLGTGGLVHAYSKSAKLGIENAGIKEMVLCCRVIIKCDYSFIGKVQYEVAEFGSAITGDIEYGESVYMTVYIPVDFADGFIAKLIDKTNGNVEIEKSDVEYFEKA